MKFKDLLDAVGENKYLMKLQTNWELADDGQIAVNFPANLTLDSEVEVHYQWFWNSDTGVVTEISNAIECHDYVTFIKWINILHETEIPFLHLPYDASMWVDNKYIGEICISFNEQTFRLITKQNYKCD